MIYMAIHVLLEIRPMTSEFTRVWSTAIALACIQHLHVYAEQTESVENLQPHSGAIAVDEYQLVEHPIAILPFRERGREVKDLGGQVADLMFSRLAVDPTLYLVDREEIDKSFAEAELTLSGIVKPDEVITVGHLTGARLLVTGSIFQVNDSLYLVAKIISTETSRVLGASVSSKASEGLDELTKRLSDEVIRTIKKNSDSLVAKTMKKVDRITALRRELGEDPKPKVLISIGERHIGRVTIDPAAETEMAIFCRATGFTVIDTDSRESQKAKYLIQGEGMSEYAGRHGNLISVKARLEIKVIEQATGKIVAVDRQTRVAVDLVEQHAGKHALQEASADIAERVLPKLLSYTAD